MEKHLCNNAVTVFTYKDIESLSNDEIVFMPGTTDDGKTIYYCLDRNTEVDEILDLGYNPFTEGPLTPEQIEFLEKYSTGNQDYIEPKRKPYADMLVRIDHTLNRYRRQYESDLMERFVTELTPKQYNVFLRHKPLQYSISENQSRDDAATQTLRLILGYVNLEKHLSFEGLDLLNAIDDFMYMIDHNLSYQQLLDERGHDQDELIRHGVKELYWKPIFIIEKFYPDGQIKERYTINEDGELHGPYETWDRNGKLMSNKYFNNGEQIE